MGFLHSNVCYSSLESARSVAAASFEARSMVGADLFTAEVVSSGLDPAMTICKRQNGGACVLVDQPWPVMADCDYAGGVSLSYDYFLVAITLLLTVWGGKKLLQLFDTAHNES